MAASARNGAGTMYDTSGEREAIRLELEETRRAFHELLLAADDEDLGRPSDGTSWTNRQLLFHMMFGYLVVRALLPLVKAVSRLPVSVGRGFAAALNAATRPFNCINYWGSVVGSRLYRDQRMTSRFDAVIAALQRRLAREREANMSCTMAYPVRWDPFFKDVMTLTNVYHYPTQHFAFHRRQLTLDSPGETETSAETPRRRDQEVRHERARHRDPRRRP